MYMISIILLLIGLALLRLIQNQAGTYPIHRYEDWLDKHALRLNQLYQSFGDKDKVSFDEFTRRLWDGNIILEIWL